MTDACFASDLGLIPAQEALSALLDKAVPVAGSETLPLSDCLGRFLRDDIASPIDVPGHDNSAMDGYAVRAADLVDARADNPLTLPVSQRIAAGQQPSPLAPASVARIFTGAPIPKGADAVIMQEDVIADENTARFSGQPP
ncbi:MAG: molybdopterin molybdenumtransferase MoeA, partial [Gammaproteobacteria bacterium]